MKVSQMCVLLLLYEFFEILECIAAKQQIMACMIRKNVIESDHSLALIQKTIMYVKVVDPKCSLPTFSCNRTFAYNEH